MSILSSIAAEIGRLRRSPSIDVEFWQDALLPETKKTDAVTRQVLRFLTFECPPSVAQSAAIENELSAYWRSKTTVQNAVVTGEFFLRSVLRFGLDNDLNPVFHREYDGVDLRMTRVFDRYAQHGGPIHALMAVVGKALDDRVLIFDEEHVYRTTLRYEGYLEQVLLTKGFYYWQYLFCEGIKLEKSRAEHIRRGLTFIQGEFSGEDHSALWDRFERMDKR
jgi:hypothetical protein